MTPNALQVIAIYKPLLMHSSQAFQFCGPNGLWSKQRKEPLHDQDKSLRTSSYVCDRSFYFPL